MQSLEMHIINTHHSAKREAQQQATAFGLLGKPMHDEQDSKPYLAPLQATYNSLLSHCTHQVQLIRCLHETKRINKEIQQKYVERRPVRAKIRKVLRGQIHTILYAQSLERHIVRLYEEAADLFIQANLLARPDAILPQCFKKPLPPLHCLFTK